jgi:ribonuclease HI
LNRTSAASRAGGFSLPAQWYSTGMETIIMHTDGGARGNPGISGAGIAVKDASGKTLKTFSKFLGHQTNNWAEYEAVALGLELLKKTYGKKTKEIQVDVMLDSELVCKQLNNEYQIKEETLFPQYIKVHNLIVANFPHITFTHVRREENKEADMLANKAMDRGS